MTTTAQRDALFTVISLTIDAEGAIIHPEDCGIPESLTRDQLENWVRRASGNAAMDVDPNGRMTKIFPWYGKRTIFICATPIEGAQES